MIESHRLRELHVRLSDDTTAHLSAASALVRVGGDLYVVADDQPYLARFASTENSPGKIIPLLDEQWPEAKKVRKAAKADFESLMYLPPSEQFTHGALFALGSGSRPNRERGVLLPATATGDWGSPKVVDLSALFALLKPKFPMLNIEAAFVSENEFVLLQRGNKADARNACARFALGDILDALTDNRSFADIDFNLYFYSLGNIAGVPLCFTDAAALPDGRFAFSVVAESVADNYNDGQCVGAAVGIADLEGNVLSIEALDQPYKVEGIEAQITDGRIDLLLVTDADAAEIPARLLRVQMNAC
jgi:hypothetical protein